MSLTYDIEDEHEQLSVDCVQLNTNLVELRRLVKKAKVHVMHELASYIKRLKKKQSLAPKQKKTRVGKKILGRLSEIRLLKKVGTVRLCKLLLANITTPEELKKGGQNLSKQDRIVVRLASRPEILAFVSDFRSQHADWPTLVHYLLYKNTSGKWKSREQKRRASKKKGDLPFPLQSELQTDVTVEGKTHSSIEKFAAFKEKHDRQLLEAHKRIVADEAAELTSIDSIPTSFSSRNIMTPSADSDSDTASQIADNIVSIIAKRRKMVSIPESSKLNLDENSALNITSDKGSVHTNRINDPVPLLSEQSNKQSRKEGAKLEAGPRNISKKILDSPTAMDPNNSTSPRPNSYSEDLSWKIEEEIFLEEDPAPLLFEDECECPLGEDDLTMVKELKEKRAASRGKFTPYISSERTSRANSHSASGEQSNNFLRNFSSRNSFGSTRAEETSRKSATETELHPSWAAKRAQKQAIMVPSGKRIVFPE